MDRSLLLIGLLVGMVFSPFSTADSDTSAKADLVINALLRDLSFYELMRDIPQTISDGLQQRQNEIANLSKERKAQLDTITHDYFSEAALGMRIRNVLRKDFDESRYATLQRLVQSPIGKRVLEAKRAAYTPAALEAIRKLAKDHNSKTRDLQRMSLYSQLDDAAADTELFIAVQALAIQSLSRLAHSGESKNAASSEEKNAALLRTAYDQLLKPSKFTTTMTYLYAFQNHSAADLQQYIQFYRFGDTQWFLAQVMEALTAAMEQATLAAEQKLAGK